MGAMKHGPSVLLAGFAALSMTAAGWLIPGQAKVAPPALESAPAAPSPSTTGPVEQLVLTMQSSTASISKGPQPLSFDGSIKRIDTPLVIRPQETNNPRPGDFQIELYRLSKRPNALLHVRQVDYNGLGYGGGLKLALEVVEDF